MNNSLHIINKRNQDRLILKKSKHKPKIDTIDIYLLIMLVVIFVIAILDLLS